MFIYPQHSLFSHAMLLRTIALQNRMKAGTDTYRHKALRRELIESLRQKGITDELVLAAMERVPRHFFLDSALDHIAYEDRAFPIAAGQTISQPFTVAYQTSLLQIMAGYKVLEIGTGSGYQAAVLSETGTWVYTIERQKELFENLRNSDFRKNYPRISFLYGDGFMGWESCGLYDRILITAAAPVIPAKLLKQLKPGGILVLPLDAGANQRMTRITKLADENFKEEQFDYFSFVPMLRGKMDV